MQKSMSDELMIDERIDRLKKAVMSSKPDICPERALIWTDYFRSRKNRKKSPYISIAEALSEVLRRKSIMIHDDELIVGNFSSKRVGGSIFPELHGIPVLLDLFTFEKRKTNPLEINPKDKWSLLKIIPFWLFKFLAMKAYKSPLKTISLIMDQMKGHYYLINEAGGISHFTPDYESLIKYGTEGYMKKVEEAQMKTEKYSGSWNFYEGIKIICEGLAGFGQRYSDLAGQLALTETDDTRKKELEEISLVCRNVPKYGAKNFHEALQSIFFTQIALNLESLDNAVSPGRMDQYLFPYYIKDMKRGILTREKAKELLSCFSIKMSEIIPVFSRHLTQFHGGMFNGQVVTVGGTDSAGCDATNELSYIFLEIMDELRMRQPNYHARINTGSPEEYLKKIYTILSNGGNSPALYCDETIIEIMIKNGYTVEDARNYSGVGCVEPVCQGKSFASTDAALFNLPVILELTLNGGRRLGSIFRTGAKTPAISSMKSMTDLTNAFSIQLKHRLNRLIDDMKAIESANFRFHPTPLTSMLIDGCIEKGACSTGGGARYNFSGIQCVGPVDTGDALRAIEKAVYEENILTLPDIVKMLKRNFPDENTRQNMKKIPKFGNDDPAADRWTKFAIDTFSSQIRSFGKNTRGGDYTTGLYSVTAHEYFGRITGALPHGRRRGTTFSSGISPINGVDIKGPTAILNSINRLDFSVAANGINFNMKFTPLALRGVEGIKALESLVKTYFKRGGMQVQINILDPAVLIEARDNPDKYPGLLVRVSGYSAYFNDLSPAMKDEIISRSTH